ncbi:Siderophore synthetase component [Nitrosospira multiformis]|uniref:Siderophore synthetase component n=1 Tax=Nitrosospira multiformis TaxID=1231 RepID=A0A1H8PUR5_9PROT|nr:IucA/IucC family protein [Nitrosospira multiformis]SEO45690.1 Siderophore synthetase component [Nitrosospira multiformis]
MLPHTYATRLAQDVLDALWLEDLYGFRTHCTMSSLPEGKSVLNIALNNTRSLSWQVEWVDGLRPFRILNPLAVLHTGEHTSDVDINKVAEVLQTAEWWRDQTGRFARFFSLAHAQAAFTAAHERNITTRLLSAPEDLLSWEALSCLKDRPFHPLARAKDWSGSDGCVYAPETATALPLRWVAISRDRIVSGSEAPMVGQPLAENLLDPTQHKKLGEIARARHVDNEDWLWLPIHPWQWEHLIQTTSPKLNECVDLGAGFGTAVPTASLRSLAITGYPDIHLKLALSVRTLGAIRTLPPRYLHNGTLASTYLESLRIKDDWLAANLLLCEEDCWWAMRQSDSLVSEPGEFACMIRRYPALPGATLIPMAALPVVSIDGRLPAFDYLIGLNGQEEAAWAMFEDIATALLELGLRCFAHGAMPELHGQNVLLAFKDQRISTLVLRDHDTLRICHAMQTQGVTIPHYIVDRSTPNTLELNTPQELLAYLQTLAIEVNLYAILAALATRYKREESHGWNIVRHALETCLSRVPLPSKIASQAKSLLLEESSWPFKQLLAPLLGTISFSTGMPSAMGQLPNPLLAISRTSIEVNRRGGTIYA